MTVYLVGAGPGDPDLLTLRAARLLGDAEVIIHDRLISQEVFELAAPWAQLVDVGKNPNGASTSQDEINDLLVHYGSRYSTVVRLKGGDPYVFGRGGEEALALAAHNIDVRVVPGISSAIAAPAAAGIPVTHRNVSSGFTVITAHQNPDNDRLLNWDALAELGTTLVILMGAKRARQISERLITAGMSPDTPAASITSATTGDQVVATLTLQELGVEPVANPAVIVIGDVAALPLFPAESFNTESMNAESLNAESLKAESFKAGATVPATTPVPAATPVSIGA